MIYERLKALCAERGTSPTALCVKITGNKGNLATWQKGNIRSDYLIAITKEFGITADYLLMGIEPQERFIANEMEETSMELTKKAHKIVANFMRYNASYNPETETTEALYNVTTQDFPTLEDIKQVADALGVLDFQYFLENCKKIAIENNGIHRITANMRDGSAYTLDFQLNVDDAQPLHQGIRHDQTQNPYDLDALRRSSSGAEHLEIINVVQHTSTPVKRDNTKPLDLGKASDDYATKKDLENMKTEIVNEIASLLSVDKPLFRVNGA